MKFIKRLIILAIIGFICCIGINIYTINEWRSNIPLDVTLEAAGRLGIMSSLESAFGDRERINKETINVLFDRYAPVQMPPILGISKEIGWALWR